MKKVLLLLACFALVAPTAIAQTNNAKSEAGATAGAAAAINSYGSVMLPNVPFQMATIIPGYAQSVFGNTVMWYIPRAADEYNKNTLDELRKAANIGGDLGKIRRSGSDWRPNKVPKNEDPVEYIKYAPPPGHVVGVRYAESVGPNEEVCLRSVLELKEKTHTRHILILRTEGLAGTTDVKTSALSVIGSGAKSFFGAGGAAGSQGGASTTTSRQAWTYTIMAFDDNIAPPPPAPPSSAQPVVAPPPPPPVPTETERKPQEITLRIEISQASSVPVAQTIRVPQVQEVPQTPVPQVREAPRAPVCEVSEFTIKFDRDRYNIGDEYRDKIERLSDQMASQVGGCEFQIQGHTSKTGTEDHNTILGRNRAEAVYKRLVLYNNVLKGRIQYASLGKDFPAIDGDPEENPENRRVIVRILGPASGK